MTTYYLSSVDGDNGSDGLSWANAFATFKYAVETVSAVAGGPHTIYVDDSHSESLSGDTTATAAADLRVLCVNRSTGALATTALVGAQALNYFITFAGAYDLYFYGITFKVPGTSADSILTPAEDGAHCEFEQCTFWLASTHSSCVISLSSSSAARNFYNKFKSCTFKFGSTGQSITYAHGVHEFVNCTIDSGGSAPTTLFKQNTSGAHAKIVVEGCGLSHVTGTLVDNGVGGTAVLVFANCKLGLNVTMLAAPATVLNKGNVHVWAFNCALDNDDTSYDEHFHLYHGDAFGETYVTEDTYCNDGATYDGTSDGHVSWQIITRASNCSYYTPYTSPWIDAYKAAADGLTLSLEGLRGSDTDADADVVAQNDEIWGEFSTQANTGTTQATIDTSDRMTPLGSATDQTSTKATTDWTISTGNDLYKSTFKLASASINQKEIGHVRARVCVGIAGKTFFVDPYIRGLT